MNWTQFAAKLAAKGMLYWMRVAATLFVGVLLSGWLQSHPFDWMLKLRMAFYNVLSSSGPHAQQVGHLRIVEISDREYWQGELAGRIPTRRDYLGKLIATICARGAAVVGLDFDFGSPFPQGKPLTHPAYEAETRQLAAAIESAPGNCKIVLARSLSCPDPPDGKCSIVPNALDAYSFNSERVTWGYINLPQDLRQIPLRRDNVANGTIDSFSQAIAIAETRRTRSRGKIYRFPYGTFISMESFRDAEAVFSAGDVLREGSSAGAAMEHQTVLIGAAWSARGYHSGRLVDSHLAPVGWIPGVFLHANYAAAIIQARTFEPLGEGLTFAVEICTLAGLIVVFALPLSWVSRWKWVAISTLLLVCVGYIFWQNLGVFLEVTVPAVLLLIHALFDEYLMMREELAHLRSGEADRSKTTSGAAIHDDHERGAE